MPIVSLRLSGLVRDVKFSVVDQSVLNAEEDVSRQARLTTDWKTLEHSNGHTSGWDGCRCRSDGRNNIIAPAATDVFVVDERQSG